MLRRAQLLAGIARATVLLEQGSVGQSVRFSSTDLRTTFAQILPREQERLKKIKKEYGDKELHSVTVNMVIGGMRGITGMLYETSLLDPEEGIRFRGYSIPELREHLPKAPGGSEPLPEALMWLLLTGEIPTETQTRNLSMDLAARGHLNQNVLMLLRSLPPGTHPMTQLSMGIMALQPDSIFAKA